MSYVLAPTWQAATAYTARGVDGDYAKPTTGKAVALIMRCIVAGMSGGSEPTWALKLGDTTVDGSATWACAAVAPFISLQDLEDRMSRRVVEQLLGDDNTGYAAKGPVARLLVDATSYVVGLIGGVYDFPLSSQVPNELQRITLDVAVGIASNRHPEYVRFNGYAILERARTELKDLRTSLSQLDIPLLGAAVGSNVDPPAPVAPVPRNVGGIVYDNSVRMVIDGADGTSNNGLL